MNMELDPAEIELITILRAEKGQKVKALRITAP